jgi:hypothetical protein
MAAKGNINNKKHVYIQPQVNAKANPAKNPATAIVALATLSPMPLWMAALSFAILEAIEVGKFSS